jgi:hypothetical protein
MSTFGAEDHIGRRCEVLLESALERGRTVVCVVGLLERSGGALLAAVLEYVSEREGAPVAVDLRGVSCADRHGLAPVIESGAVIVGTSPAVDQVLAGATRPPGAERRHRRAGIDRPPSSGMPFPDPKLRRPDRGAPTDFVRFHRV